MLIISYLHMLYILPVNNHLMMLICILTIKIDIRSLTVFFLNRVYYSMVISFFSTIWMLCDYNLSKQSISIISRYIKSLNNLTYALQALKCPACIYPSYINNGVIFIIVTVSHTTYWAGLLWLPVRDGSGHVHTWCKLGFSIVFTFCSIQEKGTCITAWDGLYIKKVYLKNSISIEVSKVRS